MSKISFGYDENDFQFTKKASKFKMHACITGQSGSSKSALAKRIAEEIVLRDIGSVFVLDYNNEFSSMNEIDSSQFTADYYSICSKYDDEDEFSTKWDERLKSKSIICFSADDIKLPFEEVNADQLAFLFDVNKKGDPGAYWMLSLATQYQSIRERIDSFESFEKQFVDFGRWSEGRYKKDEKGFQDIGNELQRLTSKSDHIRIRVGLDYLRDRQVISFKTDNGMDKGKMGSKLFISLLSKKIKVCDVDLLNYKFRHYAIRKLVVLFALQSIWKYAKERYRKYKKGEAGNSPLYIFIDEAHNVAPADESEKDKITEILETIAAEGRKFGVFLVLISQRPDKINSKIISECSNFLFMKSSPVTIDFIKEMLRIGDKENETLDSLRGFGKGQVCVYGTLSDNELVTIRSGIARTK